MSAVGRGVLEIRIRGHLEHRLFYIAKFAEAIYILHAFEKKSQRTRKTDLDLGRNRLKALMAFRQSIKEI
jgi:phage-related protein